MIQIEEEKAFKLLKPLQMVLVMTVDGNSNPTGLACLWHMKVSHNPPMYAVALKKKSHTAELLSKAEEFVVAFANHELEEEINYFSTHSGREFDKVKETEMKIRKSNYLKTPLIERATVNLECFVKSKVDAGDHIIFIGKVVAAHYAPNKKLLYYMGRDDEKRIFKEI